MFFCRQGNGKACKFQKLWQSVEHTIFMARVVSIILAAIFLPLLASAATFFSGTITTDTTWTTTESPDIVSFADITPGVTLTIEDGVVIKFVEGAFIKVRGHLQINGNTEGVYLTSLEDDNVGGDTNEDGEATSPSPGDWAGILFESGSTGSISGAKISYGGFSTGGFRGALQNKGGLVSISNSEFFLNSDQSIFALSGITDVAGSLFRDSHVGVFLEEGGGVVNISDSDFRDITDTGFVIDGGTSASLHDSHFERVNFPAAFRLAVPFSHLGNTVSDVNFGGFLIYDGSGNGDISLTSGDLPYIINSLALFGGLDFSIESGTIVKFGSLGNLEIFSGSSLKVLGTPGEGEVYFTSIKDDDIGGDTNNDGGASSPAANDFSGVWFRVGSEGSFENLIFKYGGGVHPGGFVNNFGGIINRGTDISINDSTFSHNGFAAVRGIAGSTKIDNSVFTNNQTGLLIEFGDSSATNSFFENNSVHAFTNNGSHADASNSWWGDPTGPFHSVLNPSGLGQIASGDINIFPWLTERPGETETKIPVLIIPGIAGTELYNEDDLIWPDLNQMFTDINDQFITESLELNSQGESNASISIGEVVKRRTFLLLFEKNIFEALQQVLELNSYKLDKSIFYFPYDWRLDLDSIVSELAQKIDDIKSETGSSKVDIVAHSMGGLLVKDYLDSLGEGGVNKLIFVGTPHLGAPKAAKVLINGDRLGIPWLEEDRIKEVALNSPSMYELLPSSFYFDNVSGYIKPFSIFPNDFYDHSETKDFLLQEENLNFALFNLAEGFWGKNLHDAVFSDVETYNIVGCASPTQSAYRLGLFGELAGVGYASGDETVPFKSADYINISDSNKFYARKVEHAGMPSANDIREAIVNILANEPVSLTNNFKNDPSFCGIKGKTLRWRSPVDVHVYDSQDRHTGPIENNAFEYGIPSIDYEVIGHEKFIFLPTDDFEEYQVVGRGSDNGTFDLLISENENGLVLETSVFNDVPVDTNTEARFSISEASDNTVIEVQKDTETPVIIKAVSTLIGDEAEDVISPETQVGLEGKEYNSGESKKKTEVHLIATDNNSGVLETRYSFNGVDFSNYITPIELSEKGMFEIHYYSVDKAGNNEQIKKMTISVGKNGI
jgi:pimeloyl-ACP methyl ester carboxylesterase